MVFSTFDISKILGIKRSSLQQWMNHGFIFPSEEQAIGKGTKNQFSQKDLYKIAAFWTLSLAGVSQRDAGRLSRSIEFMLDNPKAMRYGVIRYDAELGNRSPEPPKLCMGSNLKILASKEGPYLQVVINFAELVLRVDRKIAEYNKRVGTTEGGDQK